MVLLLRGLLALVLYSPFSLPGYLLAAKLNFLGPPGYTANRRFVAYLAFAALYVLKGVLIALRQRQGWLWLLPFVLCVMATCVLPPLFFYLFVHHTFKTLSPPWVWGFTAAFALFTYRRYRFTEDCAPAPVLWAYRRGYEWTARRLSY